MERTTFALIVRKAYAIAMDEANNLGIMIIVFANKSRIRLKRVYKYANGWTRFRDFYVGLITDFEKYHNEITYLVESGDVKSDPVIRQRYEKCKASISIVLRAKNRVPIKRKISSRSAMAYLNGYITQERHRQKYKTSTT